METQAPDMALYSYYYQGALSLASIWNVQSYRAMTIQNAIYTYKHCLYV